MLKKSIHPAERARLCANLQHAVTVLESGPLSDDDLQDLERDLRILFSSIVAFRRELSNQREKIIHPPNERTLLDVVDKHPRLS